MMKFFNVKLIILILLVFVGACSKASHPKIIVLTESLGKSGDGYPSDLIELWNIKSWGSVGVTEKSDAVNFSPEIELIRVDLPTEEKLVVPLSLLDKALKPAPEVLLGKTREYLIGSKISPEFSDMQVAEIGNAKSSYEKYRTQVSTMLEVSSVEPLDKVVEKLKAQMANDVSQGRPLEYAIVYKPLVGQSIPAPETATVALPPAQPSPIAAKPVVPPVTDVLPPAQPPIAVKPVVPSLPQCGKGEHHNSNGKCVCDEGLVPRDSGCQKPSPPCAIDEHRNGSGTCVKNRTEADICRDKGWIWSNGECQKPLPQCATNEHRSGGVCVPNGGSVTSSARSCTEALNLAESYANSGDSGHKFSTLNELAFKLDSCSTSEQKRYERLSH